MIYLYIALGGAAGAMARYAAAGAVQRWAGAALPWGTLAVNVAGSFALGLLFRSGMPGGLGPEARAALAIGFLGSFTTFSSFSVETLGLLQRGELARALFYALGSVALGLAAAALAMGR